MRLGVCSAVVDGEVVPGDVIVDGGLIRSVGAGPPGRSGIAVPGFVDLQVNGFAGVDFLDTDVHGYRHARRFLARSGVTSFQPTLISSPLDTFRSALEVAAKAQADDGHAVRILGVHLEGPFLAPKWKGAHDDRHLLAPDPDVAALLCSWGPVTYMTIAPEQPGGLELLSRLVAGGITVSLGHTDAGAGAAHAAYNLGARSVTHLYNAQRRFSGRDPGITGVALTRSDVVVQIIADFVHVARETVLAAWLAARGRFAVVTDAIAAAGHGPGEYRLGDRLVHVDGVSARLADGTLAGSTLTMDGAVRNLVSLGMPLTAAVAAATSVPAGLAGRPELGTLRPGTPADVAVLDDGGHVRRTIAGGEELWAT